MSDELTGRHAPRHRALRRHLVFAGFAALGAGLIARAAYLQVLDHDFYRGQGEARQLRTVAIPAHRGNLLDRHGEPLAVSTPIQTLWGEPAKLANRPAALREVAAILGIDGESLIARVRRAAERGLEFVYVRRHVPPVLVERVMALHVAELAVQREYRRYYPSGGAASHVVGFADIDDRGREGLEMAYDDWLTGRPGQRRAVRDRTGREITGTDIVRPAVAGRDLRLSVDRRLQYFADRALTEASVANRAESASAVVMDVVTGEVLAMANYPSYNPNDPGDRRGGQQRNRAITDVFEPGSTMKPFTIAAALESGRFAIDDIVDTSPGRYRIGKYLISDDGKDHGWLDLSAIVAKSSNVGVSKVARELEPEQMWGLFDRFGFGRPPGSEFPGEVAGYFNHPSRWHRIEQASVSYGYGISVSALQLARAYAALANGGVLPPVSFLAPADEARGGAPTDASDEPPATAVESPPEAVADALPDGASRVLDERVADAVRTVLEAVVDGGTGHRAGVPGYRVGGKTGTSHRARSGGYAEDRYVSVFAGFAPASDPRLAAVVVVHDPQAGEHFGSVVAAPVFADIMSHALRLEGIEPDDVAEEEMIGEPPLSDSASLDPASRAPASRRGAAAHLAGERS